MGHGHQIRQKKHTFLMFTKFVRYCPPNNFVCPEIGQKKHTLLKINAHIKNVFTTKENLNVFNVKEAKYVNIIKEDIYA